MTHTAWQWLINLVWWQRRREQRGQYHKYSASLIIGASTLFESIFDLPLCDKLLFVLDKNTVG